MSPSPLLGGATWVKKLEKTTNIGWNLFQFKVLTKIYFKLMLLYFQTKKK